MTRFLAGGAGWSHPVLIGPLEDARAELRALCGAQPVPLVTDRRLLDLYGDRLGSMLDFAPLLVPEGEQAKDWGNLQSLVERLAELGHKRNTPILAFGGGSIGDIAGLAASLFKRGCPVIQVPTTLLAQVDSALGGKTAIDTCGQKNLVGTFHPPTAILCDPGLLGTLDERQLRAGYAEVIKYGLIDDAAFFEWCEEHGRAILRRDERATRHAVEHCLRAKARLVGDDLRDTAGRRALLNLGHSFGHAIESLTGFGPVLHGEAVAVGMTLAFAFSAELGLCPEADSRRVQAHAEQAGLPASLAQVGLDGRGADFIPLLQSDKKAEAAGPVLILAKGIGKAFVARDVAADRLRHFLERL